jgi:hypothetical protein
LAEASGVTRALFGACSSGGPARTVGGPAGIKTCTGEAVNRRIGSGVLRFGANSGRQDHKVGRHVEWFGDVDVVNFCRGVFNG